MPRKRRRAFGFSRFHWMVINLQRIRVWEGKQWRDSEENFPFAWMCVQLESRCLLLRGQEGRTVNSREWMILLHWPLIFLNFFPWFTTWTIVMQFATWTPPPEGLSSKEWMAGAHSQLGDSREGQREERRDCLPNWLWVRLLSSVQFTIGLWRRVNKYLSSSLMCVSSHNTHVQE